MPTQKRISRRTFVKGAIAFAAISAAGAAGCSSSGTRQGSSEEEAAAASIIVGTMPTEDLLPLWVAEAEGLFAEHGIEVTIEAFDSAQNLSAAITAGEVDLAMTDPMRAVKLCESGTMVSMEWVTLGATAEQGRFGVMTSPDSGITSLADLVACELGVGVGANTVPEYVFEKLCEQAGLDVAAIPTSEVASLPERYTLMAEGSLDAAALPGSMLALGEASGMVLLADDSTGDNISQSVMVAREAFKEGGSGKIAALRGAWDDGATLVNADPESYRSLLAEKANLNEAVVDTYPISEYPLSLSSEGDEVFPEAALIEPQIEWMVAKGYSEGGVTYNEADGTFTVA